LTKESPKYLSDMMIDSKLGWQTCTNKTKKHTIYKRRIYKRKRILV